MKKIAIAAAMLVTGAQSAMAGCDPNGPITCVPEISALEGTAAIAALAAIVLLAWERRRRAS